MACLRPSDPQTSRPHREAEFEFRRIELRRIYHPVRARASPLRCSIALFGRIRPRRRQKPRPAAAANRKCLIYKCGGSPTGIIAGLHMKVRLRIIAETVQKCAIVLQNRIAIRFVTISECSRILICTVRSRRVDMNAWLQSAVFAIALGVCSSACHGGRAVIEFVPAGF